MWCAPAKLTEIGDFGQAPARRRCPSTAQAARALFQASGSAEPVGGPSERRGGGRPCFRHRRRQPVTLRSAALYRKPPRRPRSTHRTRCRSIGRIRSAACHMHGRGSKSPCSDVDQAQARLATLDGAGVVSVGPAGVSAWLGAALCTQSAAAAPAVCLPLAARVSRSAAQARDGASEVMIYS